MYKRYAALLIALGALSSCKQSREQLLSRKWQEVSNENQMRDQQIRLQEGFIDTVGRSTSAEENLKLYGTANIDSFKQMLREEIVQFKAAQQQDIDATRFEFKKNGVVYMDIGGNIDSANWRFDDDGRLVLDEQKMKGAGTQLYIDVLTLNDTALRIKFLSNGDSATADFRPVKKQ